MAAIRFGTYLIVTLFLSHALSENVPENGPKKRINIILLGATGDLAKRYLWKGFFNLYLSMKNQANSSTIMFYGSARIDNEMGDKTLANVLEAAIKCSNDECHNLKTEFMRRCMYHRLKRGGDFENLQRILEAGLSGKVTEIGRIFYLSVPPFAYEEISNNIAAKCRPKQPNAWVRVVLEKPFGSDLKSATELSERISKYWKENEIYRIDHYLGKAGVRQIMEFKNENGKFFEDKWNSDNIEQVKIVVKERGDAKGRMRFYDHYGVIRDVFQNHLTEILVLIASQISEENLERQLGNSLKSKLLRDIKAVTIHDAVFGQYKSYYEQLREEVPNVKANSITPTFAAVVMEIQNKRWSRVPFVLVSGKSLDTRLAYVQIKFKQQNFCVNNNLDIKPKKCVPKEITFYIQGDKLGHPLTIYSTSLPNVKFSNNWENITLDAEVSSYFKGENIIMKPHHTQHDAYSMLIHDVFLGNKDNFVTVDDLLLSWKIWNPLIEALTLIEPRMYSQENLGSLDFEIVDGKIRFSTESFNECEKSAHRKYSRMEVDDDRLHTFRGKKLVSGSSRDVVHQLANDIAIAIQRKLQYSGMFHLALSGGSTPQKLFQVLAYTKHIPWMKLHIWIVDERCVSFAHEDSNFRTLYELLLKHVSVPFLNIHPMPVDIAGQLCESEINKQYENLLRYHLHDGFLDLVVLGVGNDGHTASLFPGSSSLKSTNWVEFTASKFSGGYKRMTITLSLINKSKNVAVLMLGQTKRDIVKILSQQGKDNDDLPVNAVKPTEGFLTWYIDDEALQGV